MRPDDFPPPDSGFVFPAEAGKLFRCRAIFEEAASRVSRGNDAAEFTRSSLTDWMKQLWTTTPLERYWPLWSDVEHSCSPTALDADDGKLGHGGLARRR